MKFTIRPAVAEDIPDIAALSRATLPYLSSNQKGVESSESAHCRILKTPGSIVLVAETDGTITGFMAGYGSRASQVAAYGEAQPPPLSLPPALSARPLAFAKYWKRRLQTRLRRIRHRTCAHICEAAVDPSVRGGRTSIALFHAWKDKAWQQGSRGIHCRCIESKAPGAFHILLHLGFVVQGVRHLGDSELTTLTLHRDPRAKSTPPRRKEGVGRE